jgi:hypothetical protein
MNKSVKIPLNTYVQLERIRIMLIQREFYLKKNEVMTYALSNLYKTL